MFPKIPMPSAGWLRERRRGMTLSLSLSLSPVLLSAIYNTRPFLILKSPHPETRPTTFVECQLPRARPAPPCPSTSCAPPCKSTDNQARIQNNLRPSQVPVQKSNKKKTPMPVHPPPTPSGIHSHLPSSRTDRSNFAVTRVRAKTCQTVKEQRTPGRECEHVPPGSPRPAVISIPHFQWLREPAIQGRRRGGEALRLARMKRVLLSLSLTHSHSFSLNKPPPAPFPLLHTRDCNACLGKNCGLGQLTHREGGAERRDKGRANLTRGPGSFVRIRKSWKMERRVAKNASSLVGKPEEKKTPKYINSNKKAGPKSSRTELACRLCVCTAKPSA